MLAEHCQKRKPFRPKPKPKPRPRPKLKPKRKIPVTIIVGIVCKDAIVVASDSQTTFDNVKRLDANKFERVRFKDADILLAQSGSATAASRYIDILYGLAKDIPLTDYRTVPETAQKAMMQFREELRAIHFGCTSEELNSIIVNTGLECEIMVAYYYKDQPFIYTIRLSSSVASVQNKRFTAIGCGASLGMYLTEEHFEPDMTSEFGTAVVAYVIETVKKHDTFCGGPTRIGKVNAPPKSSKSRLAPVRKIAPPQVQIIPQLHVDELVEEIKNIDLLTKDKRNKKIKDSLQLLAMKRIRGFFQSGT